MIQRKKVVPLLLKACPSAKSSWKRHLRAWDYKAPGLFIDTTVFVHHIVDAYKRGQTREFPALFDVLERLVTEGDPEVRAVAISGLLEDLLNLSYQETFGPQAFLQWLGPASREAWFDLIDLLQCRTMIADVIHDRPPRTTARIEPLPQREAPTALALSVA